MNIDERIQALTESVRSLGSFHREIVQREDEREAERATQEAERDRLQKDRDVRIDYLHTEMMLAITRLPHTAEAHNG